MYVVDRIRSWEQSKIGVWCSENCLLMLVTLWRMSFYLLIPRLVLVFCWPHKEQKEVFEKSRLLLVCMCFVWYKAILKGKTPQSLLERAQLFDSKPRLNVSSNPLYERPESAYWYHRIMTTTCGFRPSDSGLFHRQLGTYFFLLSLIYILSDDFTNLSFLSGSISSTEMDTWSVCSDRDSGSPGKIRRNPGALLRT